MSIYDYDAEIVGEQLTPPDLRKPKFMAFLYVMVSAIKEYVYNFFNDFSKGSSYLFYNPLTVYSLGNKVVYSDRKVYMYINNTPSSGNLPIDTNYWSVSNNNFIGIDEQVKYTSQIITFEYLMNKWFFNTGATDQIYIQNNNNVSSVFVMGQSGQTSSAMAVNSLNSTSFMAVSPTFSVQYNFTIYVPSALFATLGNTPQNREQAIRNYADKFVLAGIIYNVTTF